MGTIAHDCGPEPSLRTSPSSSSSAFGSLQIPSGASTALAPTGTATPCYEGLWYGALQDLWSGQDICGAAGLLPPGRRQPGIGSVGRRSGVRFALAGIGLLMVRLTGGGAVMGGAATIRHNLLTCSRRPSGT